MHKLLSLIIISLAWTYVFADVVPYYPARKQENPQLIIHGTSKYPEYDWKLKLSQKEIIAYEGMVNNDPYTMTLYFTNLPLTGLLEATDQLTGSTVSSKSFSLSRKGESIQIKHVSRKGIKIRKGYTENSRLRSDAGDNTPLLPLVAVSTAGMMGILLVRRRRAREKHV